MPRSNIQLGGQELKLDADADTSITVDTDDQIDIKIAGADDFRFTANTFTVLSGSTFVNSGNAIQSNAGITIDNITIDGTEIDLSSGDLTIDVAGDIILDADGGDFQFKDGGTHVLNIENSSGDIKITSITNDKDIIFRGVDNSSAIDALTLDMSDAGTAQFGHDIELVQSNYIYWRHQQGGTIRANIHANSGDNLIFGLGSSGTERVRMSTSNVKFQSPDGGSRYFFGGTGDSDSAELSLYDSSDNQKVRIGAGIATFFDGGNVGIGTTSPGSPLTVVDSADSSILFQSGSTDDHDLMVMRHARASTTTNNATVISFRASGGAEVGSIKLASNDTFYDTTSDYRLKENVNYDWDATTKLKQLKPCEYTWVSDDTNKVVTGFLAHEVQSVMSNVVSGEKDATKELKKVIYDADGGIVQENIEEEDWVKGKEDGTYAKNTTWHETKTVPDVQGIDQSKLVPLLVKTIQELEARIKKLEGS